MRLFVTMSKETELKFLYFVLFAVNIIRSTPPDNSTDFECKNGQTVELTDRCNGIKNCADHSDEDGCESEAILFYTFIEKIGSPYSSQYSYTSGLKGVYLLDGREFAITSSDDHLRISNGLTARGRYVYYSLRHPYEGYDSIMRIKRNGSNNVNTGYRMDLSSLIISIAVDWITSNMYILILHCEYNDGYIINPDGYRIDHDGDRIDHDGRTDHTACRIDRSRYRIQVCSEDTSSCGYFRKNKFMKKPTSFVISPKHSILFWIEEKTTSIFSIIKSQMDTSSPIVIQRKLNTSVSLTIDITKERLYWLEDENNYKVIRSMKFDGTDNQTVVKELSMSVISIAVHNGTYYWKDSQIPKSILSCNGSNCLQPNYYPNVSEEINHSGEIGNMFIYEPPVSLQKHVSNPCQNTRCSDICVLATSSDFSCICIENELSKNEIFCEESTLLAIYSNELYVIGQVFSQSRIIRKISLELESVSAFTYDSLNGYVILAETNKQNIYKFHPRDQAMTLLVSDGSGTITSLEFDDFGNNVYWINPIEYSVKVVSLKTSKSKVVFKGNPTHVPFDITLAPDNGYMFVAFWKLKSTVIERVSMDGRLDTRNTTFYEDTEARIDDIKLYYWRHDGYLYIFDKEAEEIKYFNDHPEYRKWNVLFDSNHGSKFSGSVTSIKRNMFWTDDTLRIFLHDTNNYNDYSENNWARVSSITIGNLSKKADQTLRIAGVMNTTHRNSPCQAVDEKCDQLCLASQVTTFTCACADGFVLVNFSRCIKNVGSVEAETHFDTPVSSTARKDTARTEQTPSKNSEEILSIKTKRKHSILKSVVTEETTSRLVRYSNSTTTELPLTNHTSEHSDSAMKHTSENKSNSVFLYLVILIVSLILGVVIGYIYRGYANTRPTSYEMRNTLTNMSLINNSADASCSNVSELAS